MGRDVTGPRGGQRATRVQQYRSRQGRMPRFSWWNSTSCSRSVKRVWPSSMLKYRRPSSSLWGVATGGGKSGSGEGLEERPSPSWAKAEVPIACAEASKEGRPQASGGGVGRTAAGSPALLRQKAGTLTGRIR